MANRYVNKLAKVQKRHEKMSKNFNSEDDVSIVLKDDGVKKIVLDEFENLSTTRLNELKSKLGAPPWAARVVYNKRFGGVLICQNPSEGNRLHYHPNADECWVILEGEWEWYIEGIGKKVVKKDDIVLVRQGTPHQIKCIGQEPGIRFAITAPDVEHVYCD